MLTGRARAADQVVSGGTISHKRAELLACIARNLGASAAAVTTATHSVADAGGSDALTVVASHSLGREELSKKLPGLAELPADDSTVVADSWLSKCAEQKRLCEVDEHLHLASQREGGAGGESQGGSKDEVGGAGGAPAAGIGAALADARHLPPGQPPEKVLVGGVAVDAVGFGSMNLVTR